MNPKVDAFLGRAEKWKEEMTKLRGIILDCGLSEELKWGKPCYSFESSNIVVMVPMKNHCALIVCKGALLNDTSGILIKPGENTQAARQIRFTNMQEVVKLKPVLKAYLHEAIEVEKAGVKVKYKKISEVKIPEEFEVKLDKHAALKTAFHALTPGRQRLYLMHFSAAKQSKTREARIEKCTPEI